MDPDTVATFAGITGSSSHISAQYLGFAEGNIEQAMELFYANDGADLQPSSTLPQQSQAPPPIPSPSTRPPGHRQGYEDEEGIVHLDSDEEDGDYDDDDGNDVETTQRPGAAERPSVASRLPVGRASPIGRPGANMDDDEAMARRLQDELYGAAGRGPTNGNGISEALDEHGYRAPIGRTTETLVGPESFDPSNAEEMRAAVMEQMAARRQGPRQRDRHGIFNQATAPSIWSDTNGRSDSHRAQLSQATGGASEASSRSSLLAEMYRPPFELMSRLPWDQARQEGKDGEKWILVNIQDPSIFDCQVLNRDIWKNTGVMDTVRENFIFMQYSKDDPKGNQYVQYYFSNKDDQSAYPHIAIVDPRTGEQVKAWSGAPAPKAMDFLMQLHEFLDRYSLKATAKNPVARRKPEAKKETQVKRMTEGQMMEMALQASLAGKQEGRRMSDPDELTRSVGNFDERNEREIKDEEDNDLINTSVDSPAPNGAASQTPSKFASISSSTPHTEPLADASTTRIQFRHPNGRVVRRFTLTDPIRRMYEWLKASPLEGKEGMEFELIFMSKNLIDMLDDTIEHAGLKNGTVMIELIEA